MTGGALEEEGIGEERKVGRGIDGKRREGGRGEKGVEAGQEMGGRETGGEMIREGGNQGRDQGMGGRKREGQVIRDMHERGDPRRRERSRERGRDGSGHRHRNESRNGGREDRHGGNGREPRCERAERVPGRREEDGGRRRIAPDFHGDRSRSRGEPSKRRRGDDDHDRASQGPSHRGGRGARRGYGGHRGRCDFGGGRARGRGQGGGRGRGRGARRGRQQPEERDQFDLVVSRPVDRQVKRAEIVDGSRAVALKANFFGVLHRPNWCIYHYRVDFLPEETDTRIKKQLVRPHGPILGANLFDGSSLYSSQRLHPDPMELVSIREIDQHQVTLRIRFVAEVQPTDAMYLQVLNILIRRCLELFGLQEMGRHFYDHSLGTTIPAYHLELWPGYKTSMRATNKPSFSGSSSPTKCSAKTTASSSCKT